MSFWVCCNSCYLSASVDRKLAVTTCGHIICNVCFKKGKQGFCLICSAKCKVSPLSDKSSSEVKALFSDINVVAAGHLKEISKVLVFQARHRKRLLNYYQQKNEKQKEVLIKMEQQMQHMRKKLIEQSAYITKIEKSLQHQSAKVSSMSEMSHSYHTPQGHKSVLQIPYYSPTSLSRHSSMASVTENAAVDERSLFKTPNTVPRVSLICAPQDGQMGIVPHRMSGSKILVQDSAYTSKLRCTSLFEPFMVADSIHLRRPFTVKRLLPIHTRTQTEREQKVLQDLKV
ncbi:probable E3 SUMO-protein ligase RNF212 [Brachionichthys hirsutus]|uniref:probable E3 SUMO-protein ligase RNF212 n=1 Tax=Brachionichthys hirsutus TaxID=412623 RepID=UPI0036048DF9